MITCQELEKFLNEYLDISNFQDYGPNGLQIEGRQKLKKIAFAVSACKESIEKAVEQKVDAMIVHHGLFWRFHGARAITGPIHKRISPLIKNDINLLGYHLPLDAHPEAGNAAGIAHALGMKNLEEFGEYKRAPLGVKGSINSCSPEDFKNKLEKIFDKTVLWSNAEKDKISSVGIITGGANNEWHFAYQDGLDAYITGEMSEHNFHEAKEHNIHMYAGGHHATERFGVLSLQKLLEKKFKLETIFIDSDNPA